LPLFSLPHDDVGLCFADHGEKAYKPQTQLNGPFAAQLGLELTETGLIKVAPPFNETSVTGVFAAGDCASPMPAVLNALTMGAFAAVGTTMQLHVEPVPDGDALATKD